MTRQSTMASSCLKHRGSRPCERSTRPAFFRNCAAREVPGRVANSLGGGRLDASGRVTAHDRAPRINPLRARRPLPAREARDQGVALHVAHEAFLHYAEENPDDVLVAADDKTDALIRELEAQQREARRSLRRAAVVSHPTWLRSLR